MASRVCHSTASNSLTFETKRSPPRSTKTWQMNRYQTPATASVPRSRSWGIGVVVCRGQAYHSRETMGRAMNVAADVAYLREKAAHFRKLAAKAPLEQYMVADTRATRIRCDVRSSSV